MLVVVMKLIAGVTTVLLAPCITEPCMGTGKPNKPNLACMCGSRGEQGVRTPPPPLGNHKNIGFLNNTDPGSLKLTKLPSQHSMLGDHQHASETPVVGKDSL